MKTACTVQRKRSPGLASKLGYFQFFLGGEQGERNAIEAIRNVDAAALQSALDTWVRPDRLSDRRSSPHRRETPGPERHPRRQLES